MLLTGQNTVEFERVKPGAYIGRCYLISDLGTQTRQYMGDEKRERKILFIFELPTAKMEDGRPFAVNTMYTASINDRAKLKPFLESWRGHAFTEEDKIGFDPSVFLGLPAYLSIVEGKSEKTNKVYTNIGTIMQLPDGTKAPKPINAPVYFSLDEYNQAAFDSLPEWIQKKVKESPEYKAIHGLLSENQERVDNGFNTDELLTEDDIPF